ncbi:hypothetical protein CRUP_015106 [Coryphaenoides rupestris]|nr:hypothetical protein CRUP_015106 [Coryphaenoides rupestris]
MSPESCQSVVLRLWKVWWPRTWWVS